MSGLPPIQRGDGDASAARRSYAPLAGGPPPGVSSASRRQPSPAIDKRRASSRPAAVLQSQGTAAARQKDKFVPLGVPGDDSPAAAPGLGPSSAAAAAGPAPVEQHYADAGGGEGAPALDAPPPPPPQQQQQQQQQLAPPPALFLDLEEPVTKGRIAVITLAESLDRAALEQLLRAKFPRLQVKGHQEVLHATPSLGEATGDAFFFDYGTVVFWGISTADEQALMATVVRPCAHAPLDISEVEIDSFSYTYSAVEPPHVQNDTLTLNKRFAQDHQVKMAISHALAQSTKLAVYEQRLQSIVKSTAHLPEDLATTGKVRIGSKAIARLIGQVFLLRSAVNLLSSVLDTPEFFWSAPDHLQVLYKRVCEYMEIDTRVEVLNTRFVVLQEFLDLLREHQANKHMVRLELVVIYLILVEVVVGLFEVAGLIGWMPGGGARRR